MHIIANFKDYLSLQHTIEYLSALRISLEISTDISLTLCPSSITLYPARQLLQDTRMTLGAQDVSPFPSGPHTGLIHALSLKEVGCQYALIGHQEQRLYNPHLDYYIGRQLEQLIAHSITPVFCIGERTQVDLKTFTSIITEQLLPLNQCTTYHHPIIFVAYEPAWAIGSDTIPDLALLEERLTTIFDICHTQYAFCDVRLFYGGSIQPRDTEPLVRTTYGSSNRLLHGLLIGKSSLDLQKLQKIVSLKIK